LGPRSGGSSVSTGPRTRIGTS